MIPDPTYYTLAIPATAETSKNRATTKVPFGTFWSGCRYQQVFNASHFSKLPPGGGFMFRLYFRPGCGGTQGTFMTNTVVRMCTTARAAGQLSPVFDENLGADVLTVATVPLSAANGYLPIERCVPNPPLSDTLAWYLFMRLRTPFLYNPAKGNLLLELLISAHVPELDQDFENSPILLEPSAEKVDGISSIAAGSTNALSAEVVNPYGLVAQVVFAPFPTLSVTPTDTNLVLSWPSHPEPIRLQHKDSLDPSVAWRDYTEPGIQRFELTSLLEIPRASLQARRYFRLYWNSPQVGLPDTTVEVGPEPAPTPVIP
ncbi:MAG: hypothetical protein JNN07_25525 [Verrucomicrobiales bacterium]|nr:hypothetical protein [Verrucomicrobiales bacterium]